jgi:hypothetical protein
VRSDQATLGHCHQYCLLLRRLKPGTYRYKDLRRLIGQQSEQKAFAFAGTAIRSSANPLSDGLLELY